MRLPPPLVMLMVAVIILVDVAIYLVRDDIYWLDSYMNEAIFTWAMAQISLLAVWVGMARSLWVTRFAVAAANMLFWSWLLGHGPGFSSVFAILFSLHAILIAVPLFVFRWRGYQLQNPVWDAVSEDADRGPDTPPQYSLWQLMLWITATALVLGVANGMGIFEIPGPHQLQHQAGQSFILGAGFAFVGLLAVWAAFSRNLGIIWVRIPAAFILVPLVFILASVVSPIVSSIAFGRHRQNWETTIMIFFGYAA